METRETDAQGDAHSCCVAWAGSTASLTMASHRAVIAIYHCSSGERRHSTLSDPLPTTAARNC